MPATPCGRPAASRWRSSPSWRPLARHPACVGLDLLCYDPDMDDAEHTSGRRLVELVARITGDWAPAPTARGSAGSEPVEQYRDGRHVVDRAAALARVEAHLAHGALVADGRRVVVVAGDRAPRTHCRR